VAKTNSPNPTPPLALKNIRQGPNKNTNRSKTHSLEAPASEELNIPSLALRASEIRLGFGPAL
jgi:hypothetical protein